MIARKVISPISLQQRLLITNNSSLRPGYSLKPNNQTRSAFRETTQREENENSWDLLGSNYPKIDIQPQKPSSFSVFDIHSKLFRANFRNETEKAKYVERLRRAAHFKPKASRLSDGAFKLISPLQTEDLLEFKLANRPGEVPRTSNYNTDPNAEERPPVRRFKESSSVRFPRDIFTTNHEPTLSVTPLQRNYLNKMTGSSQQVRPGATENAALSAPTRGIQPETVNPRASDPSSVGANTNQLNPSILRVISRNYDVDTLETIDESVVLRVWTPRLMDNIWPEQQGSAGRQLTNVTSMTQKGTSQFPNTVQSIGQGPDAQASTVVAQKNYRIKLEKLESSSDLPNGPEPTASDDSSQSYVTGTLAVQNSPIKQTSSAAPLGVRPAVAVKVSEMDQRQPALSFGPQGDLPTTKDSSVPAKVGTQPPTADEARSPPKEKTTPADSGAALGIAQTTAPSSTLFSGLSKVENKEPAVGTSANGPFFTMNATETGSTPPATSSMFSGLLAASLKASEAPKTTSEQQNKTEVQALAVQSATAKPEGTSNPITEPGTGIVQGAASSNPVIPTSLFSGEGASKFFSKPVVSDQMADTKPTDPPITSGFMSGSTPLAAPGSKPLSNPFLQPHEPKYTSGSSILESILEKNKESSIFGTFGSSSGQANPNSTQQSSNFFGGGTASGSAAGSSSFFNNKDQVQSSSNIFGKPSIVGEERNNRQGTNEQGGSSFFSGTQRGGDRQANNSMSSFFGGSDANKQSSSTFFGGSNNNYGANQSRVDEERGFGGGNSSQGGSSFFGGASSSTQQRPAQNTTFFGQSGGGSGGAGSSTFFGGASNNIFQTDTNKSRGVPEMNQHGMPIKRLGKPNQDGGQKFW